MAANNFDFGVIGAGIVGLAMANRIRQIHPNASIAVFDKENSVGEHASGRNSGVLHAGFYYSPDSLKAKFCRLGNLELRKFCKENNLRILETGKVVVCQDKQDVLRLEELYRRGVENGVDIEIHSFQELNRIEPAAQTIDKFIWSPTTAVGSPKDVIEKLSEKFIKSGGKFLFNQKVKLIKKNNEVLIQTKLTNYFAEAIINSAGAYAAELAKQVNVGREYVCMPFLGAYKKSSLLSQNPKRLVYPVPNPVNPFLGVHTTITLNNELKIGPTAFPVIGKEQYNAIDGFSFKDLTEFLSSSKALLRSNSVNLLGLAQEEVLKLFTKPLLNRTKKLSYSLQDNKNWVKHPSGIRAQIINTKTKTIEMDYIVESDKNVVHVLNAVSPGWTSSLPFARWVVENQPLLA